MSILIVSTNPLFKEVIIATVAQFNIEFIELRNPEESLTKVCELKPDVIIIDETVIAILISKDLLAEARGLEKTRIIVLNPDPK
jgi:chemotaxis response regulator CheB